MSNQGVGGRVRPPTVTAAAILLRLIALGLVVRGALAAVLAFVYHGFPGGGVVVDVSQKTLDQVIVAIGIFVPAVFGLVAVGVSATTLFVVRGSNPARVMAWVFMALTLLCCGCGGLSDLAAQLPADAQPADSGIVVPAGPTWLNLTDAALAIVVALVALTVIVLLAVPASNNYFRPAPAGWVPPGYPGGPGYAQPAQYPYAQPPQYPYAQPPQYPYAQPPAAPPPTASVDAPPPPSPPAGGPPPADGSPPS